MEQAPGFGPCWFSKNLIWNMIEYPEPVSRAINYSFIHISMGFMQERRNPIANALELHLSCTNPSILYGHMPSDIRESETIGKTSQPGIFSATQSSELQ